MNSSLPRPLPILVGAGILLAAGLLLWSPWSAEQAPDLDLGLVNDPSGLAPRPESQDRPAAALTSPNAGSNLAASGEAAQAPQRKALEDLHAAPAVEPVPEVEALLADLLGARWPQIKAELGPVRLAALSDVDLSTLPSWTAVQEEVFGAGQMWIEERRGTWPGGLSDRWRDVDRLDFARSAFNRDGVAIDADLDAHLRALVHDYNGKIDRLARNFWDEVSLAFDQEWRPDRIVPLPDPSGAGRDQADLELWGIPGSKPGVLLDVVAADQGWRVELPLVPAAAPAAARLLESIRELERQRLADVRAAISGR